MQLRRQQQQQPLKPDHHHKQLYGRERLFNVIKCLRKLIFKQKNVELQKMSNYLNSKFLFTAVTSTVQGRETLIVQSA